MSTEENKALVRRGFDTLNERNWTTFYELVAPEIVAHIASMTLQGLEAYQQFLSENYTAFPDLHFTLEDMIAEGDRVVARYTGQGTHQGDLMGIPPTDKPVSVTNILITRIANGKAVEQWLNYDALGMLQQIGAHNQPPGSGGGDPGN